MKHRGGGCTSDSMGPARKRGIERLIELIAEAYCATAPVEILGSLNTEEGAQAFQHAWPDIVDAYFHALSKPRARSTTTEALGSFCATIDAHGQYGRCLIDLRGDD